MLIKGFVKRKVNRVGKGTLTVSLPSEWTKAHGIKQGDEVEVSEDGKILTITLEGAPRKLSERSIDVAKHDVALRRLIGAVYKAGYDKVEIIYSSPEELKIVQDVVNRTCIGFEIVEQSKKRIVLRQVSKLAMDDFDKISRRLFLTLLDMGKDLADALAVAGSEDLPVLIQRDDQVNRYSDFCRRVLNKDPLRFERSGPLYFILEQLERIGDLYRDVAGEAEKDKMGLGEDMLGVFREINKYLRDYYELFYKYSLEGMDKFLSKNKIIHDKLMLLEEKAKKEELKYIFYFMIILQSTFDMNGALMTMHE